MSVPAEPLRKEFARDLGFLDDRLVQLFAMVTEALAAATECLLTGDRAEARLIVSQDAVIDELYEEIEEHATRALVLQAPAAGDMRFVLSILRMVPELERSGDLAEHIAARAADGLGGRLTPALRGLVARLGEKTLEMWRTATEAYADRNVELARSVADMDHDVNRLHAELTFELAQSGVEPRVIIDMALVARFFERLGDHAEQISARIPYLAGED
jgi:phosphate transport system protein